MAEGVITGAMPLLPGLPDELAIWEILIRLPPKSLLRCRAVCRAWRRATSIRAFLLAHHDQQASLPIVWGQLVSGSEHEDGARYEDFLAFDHRATNAQLQPVARLDQPYLQHAICDGLLILSKFDTNYSTCFSICNPVTRENAPLRQLSGFNLLGMYLHHLTGEYRLLLHRRRIYKGPQIIRFLVGKSEKISCYVFVLGSDQPPRNIQGLDVASGFCLETPTLVRDSLHWFPVQHQSQSRPVIVFDKIAESFREMRAPVVPSWSSIFEIDGTLGIYSYDDAMEVVDIWVLQNYEGEVWEYKYRVKLPLAEMREQFGRREDCWDVTPVTVDGDILLLLSHGQWLFYVDIDGKLVDSFRRDGQDLSPCGFQLKPTLVPHTFFRALEDYVVNASPFI